jgi:hypothetical protein
MKKLVFTQVENTSKQTDVMYFSNFSLRPLALEKQFSPTLRPALGNQTEKGGGGR